MSRGISTIKPYKPIQFAAILLATGTMLYGIVYVTTWTIGTVVAYAISLF